MRLKSLELSGYKTFAKKSTFEFAETITAIVGPNGSGKSNIVDSLRWVLGEQSFSLLRGRKTIDMIFSGSEDRARAGMASASVLFDNENNWLPIDFSEVSITRRAYRDGQNDYLLNGQKVRLKDVSELLGTSGLAERTYTIVGQGLIDAALSLKADERRKLFEEAAGIGLYRSRREESLRRLDLTQRNLERVQDILEELKPRLRSLERQSRRAAEYEQVKADLQVMLREWYGFHWHAAQRELKAARDLAARQENILTNAREKHAKQETEMAALRDNLFRVRARLNSWHRESAQLHNHRGKLSRELAVTAERQRALEERQTSISQALARHEEELVLLQDRLEQSDRELERTKNQFLEANQQVQYARAALQARQQERDRAEQILEETRQQHNLLASQRAGLTARQTELESRIEVLRSSMKNANQALEEVAQTVQVAGSTLEKTTKILQDSKDARVQAQTRLQTHTEQITVVEKNIQQANQTLSQQKTEMARVQAQLDVLIQAETSLSGYAEGARQLLQTAQQGNLKGTRGALSSHLEVPAELDTAIAAALEDFVDGILLEPDSDLDEVLQLLEGLTARAALLPLAHLAPLPPIPAPETADCLGNAAQLIQAPAELRPVLDVLLGQTWVARDRDGAQRLMNHHRSPAGALAANLRIVTLAGELFRADGPIQAGSGGVSGTISRPRQRRELMAKLDSAITWVEEAEEEINQLGRELAKSRQEEDALKEAVQNAQRNEEKAQISQREAAGSLDAAQKQKVWQGRQREAVENEMIQAEANFRQLTKDLAELDKTLAGVQGSLRTAKETVTNLVLEDVQTQVAHWTAHAAVGEQAVGEAETRCKERQAALEISRQDLGDERVQLSSLIEEVRQLDATRTSLRGEEGKIGEQITSLQALIQPSEVELEIGEGRLEQLQSTETEARHSLTVAERHHTQAQIGLARNQDALDNLRRRIEDDFGLVAFSYEEDVAGPTPLPLAGMVETLPLVHTLSPDLEDALKRQRTQLRRIGPINPEAQREFVEVKQRFEFTTDQITDLEMAEQDIRRVISELDELMEREFRKTFDEVAKEFKGIFARLFGGGSAQLVLTDPEDLTNTGVDIEARLPGRRSQELSLLSGGERSLTAIALIFSLLKISPTPFCVMDEVDAMLDEANVHRFAELLRELSSNTQIIIITHNRNTIQVADTIYGITMGADSTSQILSLKLDDVVERIGDLK